MKIVNISIFHSLSKEKNSIWVILKQENYNLFKKVSKFFKKVKSIFSKIGNASLALPVPISGGFGTPRTPNLASAGVRVVGVHGKGFLFLVGVHCLVTLLFCFFFGVVKFTWGIKCEKIEDKKFGQITWPIRMKLSNLIYFWGIIFNLLVKSENKTGLNLIFYPRGSRLSA